MSTKTTAMIALLIPGIAMLAACNRAPAPDADGATATSPAASTPATPPADTMPADQMASMPGMTGDGMSFADMDKNGDSSISKDELSDADMLHQHFSVADADGDGKLSDAEVMKHRADMAAGPAKY